MLQIHWRFASFPNGEEGAFNNIKWTKNLSYKYVRGGMMGSMYAKIETNKKKEFFFSRQHFFKGHIKERCFFLSWGLAGFHNGHHIHRKNNFNRFNYNLFSLKRLLHRFFFFGVAANNCHSQSQARTRILCFTKFENHPKNLIGTKKSKLSFLFWFSSRFCILFFFGDAKYACTSKSEHLEIKRK